MSSTGPSPVVVAARELKDRYTALLTREPPATPTEMMEAIALLDAAHERLTGDTSQPAAQMMLDIGTQ